MGGRRRRHARVAIAAMAVAVLGASAAAAPPIVGEGAMLAAPCAACHGAEGHGPGGIPPIAGLPAEAMADLLLKYRSGEVQGTVMNRIATGYTPEQIQAIAEHVAHLGMDARP